MIAVLVIPTGVGATIGGNAGDGNPVAKLLAKCCDTLITHPNVVNASDINEMTDNTLYVEGSTLNRFLEEMIGLKRVATYNKILVVTNEITGDTVNAVNAARATIGVDAIIYKLPVPLIMTARVDCGRATGYYSGVHELVESIKHTSFDALAIHTPIEVDRTVALNYYENGGVNPWGGVEALVSKEIATTLGKPVAHAPIENARPEDIKLYPKIVASRIAAEAVSCCYLHCVMKGLHRAPRVCSFSAADLDVRDISVLISPYQCWGKPHELCKQRGIPIMAVVENEIANPVQCFPDIIVENYLEAAGYLQAMRAGVHPDSVRANLPQTIIIGE